MKRRRMNTRCLANNKGTPDWRRLERAFEEGLIRLGELASSTDIEKRARVRQPGKWFELCCDLAIARSRLKFEFSHYVGGTHYYYVRDRFAPPEEP